MALRKSIEAYGLTFPNAYFKIEKYSITEGRVDSATGKKYYIARPYVACYADSTKVNKIEPDQVIPSKPRQDFTEAGNSLASMYAWLKTLPEFDGAVDA